MYVNMYVYYYHSISPTDQPESLLQVWIYTHIYIYTGGQYRSMLKFLQSVVAGSGSGLKDLPYNIGEPYSSAWGSWIHSRGTSRVILFFLIY